MVLGVYMLRVVLSDAVLILLQVQQREEAALQLRRSYLPGVCKRPRVW